ncbi:MAG: glyoxalase [Agathobacter sp.]|nr:glyoxalase [Agathobacter sp.]
MYNYDDEVLEVFLENQGQLFPENVAETPEEAEEFLDDCMAVVCKNFREVKEYFEEAGTDIAGMSDDDIMEASEVFALPSGRFLIVEG